MRGARGNENVPSRCAGRMNYLYCAREEPAARRVIAPWMLNPRGFPDCTALQVSRCRWLQCTRDYDRVIMAMRAAPAPVLLLGPLLRFRPHLRARLCVYG